MYLVGIRNCKMDVICLHSCFTSPLPILNSILIRIHIRIGSRIRFRFVCVCYFTNAYIKHHIIINSGIL